jgi:hypothetical protein
LHCTIGLSFNTKRRDEALAALFAAKGAPAERYDLYWVAGRRGIAARCGTGIAVGRSLGPTLGRT